MAPAERRKQLLATACEILESDGVGGLTMTELAERAGVSKPVVYGLFTCSQDVAIALLHEHFRASFAFWEARLETAGSMEAYVDSLVAAAFAFERVSDIPVRKITNGFSAGDAVNQVFLGYQTAARDNWKQLLLLLDVQPQKAELAAYAFGAMIRGSLEAASETDQRDVAAAMVTAFVLGALKTLGARWPEGKHLNMAALWRHDSVQWLDEPRGSVAGDGKAVAAGTKTVIRGKPEDPGSDLVGAERIEQLKADSATV